MRSQLSTIKNTHKSLPSSLNKDERKVLRDLKQSEDTAISKANKGNTTVILDRKAYDEKLFTMLSDTLTYEELKRDLDKKAELEVNHFISKLRSEGKITVSDTLLKSSDAHPPRLY